MLDSDKCTFTWKGLACAPVSEDCSRAFLSLSPNGADDSFYCAKQALAQNKKIAATKKLCIFLAFIMVAMIAPAAPQ